MRGGCLCGAVRFELAAQPFDAGWCHCRTCQRNSGSPAVAFASIAPEDYRFEQGVDALRTIRSSEAGERVFCSQWGTPLMMRETDGSGTWDFNLATLDEPAQVKPEFHIFYSSHLNWAPAADELPRHPRGRSNSEPQ